MEKVFESENLIYVKTNEELIKDYLIMMNNKDVRKFISKKPFEELTYKDELDWVNDNIKNDKFVFSILEKHTNNYVGNIEIKIKDSIGELGIVLTPLMQDKHYGSEAIKAIINQVQIKYKLDEIGLNVYKTNPRAIHCYEKVGFVKVGQGKTEDDYYMKYMKK